MLNPIDYTGEIFRTKGKNGSLCLVAYHGKNFFVYRILFIDSNGYVDINENDFFLSREEFFKKKEATGLKYQE